MYGKTNVQLILANCVKLVNDVKSPLSKAWRCLGGIRRVDVLFLNLVAGCRCVVNMAPKLIYLLGNEPITHWIEGRTNPRAGLNEPEKRKIFFPSAGIRTQIFQSVN